MRDCGKRPAGFGMIRSFTGVKPDFLKNALRAFRAGKKCFRKVSGPYAQYEKNAIKTQKTGQKIGYRTVLSLWS